jgi:cell wall-associated NlpC family hydrolase
MSRVDDVIAYGSAEVGKPYVYGAEGPSAFDCSGLIQYVFAKAGISLPRTAAQQQRAVTQVTTPRAGDLIFWGAPAHHVALYLGGGRMLAAPHSGAKVQVAPVYGSPTYGRPSGLGLITQPIGWMGDAAGAVGFPSLDEIAAKTTQAITIGVLTLGGVVLVGLGAWQATRGKQG